MDTPLPPQLIKRIEELIDASYSGRDELYAAAAVLDDEKRANVCKNLAEHLANHAIELQQVVAMNGGADLTPIDMYAVAESFFVIAKSRHGDAGVLHAAEECERTVKDRFDNVIDNNPNDEANAILERQRDDIEFGENVLKSMQDPPE